MFLPGNKTQGHLRWASPWFSRFGTREPGTPPAKQFRSNPRGPLQSVRSTLGFLFLLSACPGKMRPSRHSVLPAATLPRCHTAPLERGRLEQACAECRTQPIVRVYTFGERSTSKQKKMQQRQRQDMGEGHRWSITGSRRQWHTLRSGHVPLHGELARRTADNDTPSEVATSDYTPSLHAGQPPALLALRSSCCAASQSYRRPGPGTVVFAERDRERLCRREQNVCRTMPVLAGCAEQPPAARAARHARQPGSLPHAFSLV